MNRLAYLLKAETCYHLHSPFMYELYDSVLTARLPQRKALGLPRKGGCYYAMLYKMASHFDATEAWIDTDDSMALHCLHLAAPNAVVHRGTNKEVRLRCGTLRVALLQSPHRNKQSEQLWQQLCADSSYEVSIDMYDVGIALYRGGLHPQHFMLR